MTLFVCALALVELTWHQSRHRAKVSPQVSEEFQKLKRSNDKNRLLRYIIFKLSDDYSEIEVEHAEPDSDWENFREKLLSATSKSKTVRLTADHPLRQLGWHAERGARRGIIELTV
jgi:hypothetical protein